MPPHRIELRKNISRRSQFLASAMLVPFLGQKDGLQTTFQPLHLCFYRRSSL